MPGFDFVPAQLMWAYPAASGLRRICRSEQQTDKPLEARVKRECAELYPGINPNLW